MAHLQFARCYCLLERAEQALPLLATGPSLGGSSPACATSAPTAPAGSTFARRGRPRGQIGNPGRMDAAGIIAARGECHRLPGRRKASPAPERDDPLNVRFQPLGLLASRCFTESRSLSCLSSQELHADARKDSEHYVG